MVVGVLKSCDISHRPVWGFWKRTCSLCWVTRSSRVWSIFPRQPWHLEILEFEKRIRNGWPTECWGDRDGWYSGGGPERGPCRHTVKQKLENKLQLNCDQKWHTEHLFQQSTHSVVVKQMEQTIHAQSYQRESCRERVGRVSLILIVFSLHQCCCQSQKRWLWDYLLILSPDSRR